MSGAGISVRIWGKNVSYAHIGMNAVHGVLMMTKKMMIENSCDGCEYYDPEDDVCKAFSCNPFECDLPLPCEEGYDENQNKKSVDSI